MKAKEEANDFELYRLFASGYFITARIRRMGEGTVFSLFVSPHPLPEQLSEYVLRAGRYASCVHAGGISCKFHLIS